jgi:hypothetical protein
MTDKQQRQHEQKARQAQAKAQINRDEARRKLLRQRKSLARRRTRNRRQSEPQRDDDDGSQNPTAHSTLPPQKSNVENATRNSNSTVPSAPKYSTVPARERLYGLRLHRKTREGNAESPEPTAVSEDETGDEEVSPDE